MALICFSHGKESGPDGTKIIEMRKVAEALGHETMSVDYRGLDEPMPRVEKLLAELENKQRPLVLVGSSMGSFVSIVASGKLEPEGLFLLAPAVYLDGYNHIELKPVAKQVRIIHGWSDEIVPCENVIKFAQKFDADLYLTADEHRLANSIPLIKEELHNFLQSLNL